MTNKSLFKKFAAILSFVLLLQFVAPSAAQAVDSSATLSGHIYSSEDRSTPIQNVGISTSFGYATSTQDGGFSLSNLRAGNITLWVSKESPSNSTSLGRYISKQIAVSLVAGPNTTDIFLTPYAIGPNNVSGTVSDETDTPVSAAQLSLSSGNWPNTRYFQVNSRADGTFDFTDLPSGKYQVSIYKSERNADNNWVSAFYPKNFEISLPLQSSDVSWRIVRTATKLLSGVVASKNDPTIVYENASVSICVVTFGQNICQWSRTDALGMYSVTLPPGNGTLSVYGAEFRYQSEPVTMGAVDTTHDVNVDPFPIGSLSIEGTVTDESGIPLEGVRVSTSSTFPVPSQTTGSDGKFKFERLLSGEYYFSVYADGFNSPIASKYVRLASTNKTGVNIKMQRAGTDTLSGRVLDAEGLPVEGANITVEQVGGNYQVNPLLVTTDALGQFTAGQLTPGQTYSLFANKNGYLTSNKIKALPQGGSVTLELRPWRTGNSIVQGTVRDSSGNPIESQTVYLYFNTFNGYGETQNYSVPTNLRGEFRFENLPSGQAQLSSSLSGGTNCYKTIILNGNDTKAADCKFYEKSSTVELQFVSSTGAILNPDNIPPSEFCGSPCINQQLTWSEGPTGSVSEYLSGTFDASTGTSTFTGVPKSSESVLRWSMSQNASSDEYLPEGWYTAPISLDTTTSGVTKKIIVPSFQGTNSIHGVVRNVSGVALQGVRISWNSWAKLDGDRYSKSGIAITDSSGSYSIPDLLENSGVYISFDPQEQIDPAYKSETGIAASSLVAHVPTAPSSRTRNLVLKYEPSVEIQNVEEANGSYTARLVDTHGDPVAGVSGSLSGSNISQMAISDADGTIEFNDLEAGLYYFYVDSDSNTPYIPMSQGATVAITQEALNQVEANPFVMQSTPRGLGRIKGKLLDRDSHIGVTGLGCEASLIQLDDTSVRNYWPWVPCNLDASGDWSIDDLPAGTYSVRFVANQDDNGMFANQFELPAVVSAHVDGTSTTDRGTDYVNVYSLKTNSSVVVSLYDAETRLPISNVVNCNLNSPSIAGMNYWTPTKSDKTGKVTFSNLVAGKNYELSCGTTRLRLIAQEGLKTARAYIEQFDAKFKGRITDSQGNPIEGIRVEGNRTKEIIAKEIACRCGDGEEWTVDTTDAEGYYYLNGVRHGESILQITDYTGRFAPILKPLLLNSGTNPDINIQLKSGAYVSGTLTDSSGKSLLDSSFVSLEAVNQVSSMYWASPVANTSGFAFNSPVGEGDYYVSVTNFGGEGSANFGSGYLQNDGSIKLAKSTARVIHVRPDVEAKVSLPPLVQERAGSISGQLLFKSSDGTPLASDYLSGSAAIYYQDGSEWVKSKQLTTWVGVWNSGYFKLDGVLPGSYKVKFEDGGSGLFGASFANNQSSLEAATTYVVTAGQKTSGANGVLSYSLPTLSSSNFLTLQSLNEGQITILREAVAAQQVGKRVRVKAPDDMVGQYVAATISSRNASRQSIGIASASSTATSWMQVDSEGFVTIPEEYIGTNDETFVFVNAKNIAVGIADVAGVAAVTPTPPVVTPTPPQLVAQRPGTKVPSTLKPGKKLVLKAKTNMGSAVKVTAKGCKVAPTYKTTISYKTKKVGKKTVRTKVTTKTLISYSVTMGKKGSTCTVTQTSPATTTLAAMTNVTAIKVK